MRIAAGHRDRVGVEVEAGAIAGLFERSPIGYVDGIVVVQNGLQAVGAGDGRPAGNAQVTAVDRCVGPGGEVAGFEAVGE